jgi:acyl carrier protein
MNQRWDSDAIHQTIIETVGAFSKSGKLAVAGDDDVFSVHGLNSMETFRVMVKLEHRFGIEIGAHPSDFERARSLAGLVGMVAERLLETAAGSGGEP